MVRRRTARKRNYRGELYAANMTGIHSPVLEAPAEHKRIKLQNNPLYGVNATNVQTNSYVHNPQPPRPILSQTNQQSQRNHHLVPNPSAIGVALMVPLPNVVSTRYKTKSPRKPPKARDSGDYSLKLGEILSSDASKYEVLEYLGRGTFGQVVKCIKRGSSDVVAIKILKNHPNYIRQGQIEVSILNTLEREQADRCNIVKALDIFKHHNHTCLAFELLEMNLYDYLKQSKFAPMSLKSIRPIAQQILVALIKLKQLGLVHADLKPENIMLIDPVRQPFRIKVIDFGSAAQTNRTIPGIYLQSRYYRAPEVLVGHAFTEAIDMWSLGCVLSELFLGWPLYPGSCEYDQIRYICETQGLFPGTMLNHGSKSRRFFKPTVLSPGYVSWRLKSPDEYTAETGRGYRESRKYVFSCLDDITQANLPATSQGPPSQVEVLDRGHFVEMLKGMLTIDPKARIQPSSAIRTPFISMAHLNGHPNYLQQCRYEMGVCSSNRITTNSVDVPQSPFNLAPISSTTSIYSNNYAAPPQVPHIPNAAVYNHGGTAAYFPFQSFSGFSQMQDNLVANPLYWAATAAAAAAAAACSHFPPIMHQSQPMISSHISAPFEVGKFPFNNHHMGHRTIPQGILHSAQQQRQPRILLPFPIPPNPACIQPPHLIYPNQQPTHSLINGHHLISSSSGLSHNSEDRMNQPYLPPSSDAQIAAYAAAAATFGTHQFQHPPPGIIDYGHQQLTNFNNIQMPSATPQRDLESPMDNRFLRKPLQFTHSLLCSPNPQYKDSVAAVQAASVAAAFALAGSSGGYGLSALDKLNSAVAAVAANGYQWSHHQGHKAHRHTFNGKMSPSCTSRIHPHVAVNTNNPRILTKLEKTDPNESVAENFMISSPESITDAFPKEIKRSSSRVTVITISSGEDDDLDAKRAERKISVMAEAKVRKSSVNINEL